MARTSAGKRTRTARTRSPVVLLVLLVACSGGIAHGPDTTVSTSPATVLDTTAAELTTVVESTADDLPVLDDVTVPEWVPATRTEELNSAISGGEPTVQMAVDAFNVTIGPMPGATPSALPPGPGVGTSTARRLIEAARDQLSPDQRAALDAFDASAVLVGSIATDGSETLATQSTDLTTPPASGFRRPQAPGDVEQRYLALLKQANADWKAYRPDFLMPGQELSFLNTVSAIADMDTDYPIKAANAGTTGPICDIRVYAGLWKTAQPDEVILTAFAHELFHCVQRTWNPSGGFPNWLVEGSAHFAAFDLYRGTFSPPDRYADQRWFDHPLTQLGARSYEAWPLYESFRQFGGKAYDSIKLMFTSVNQQGTNRPTTADEWLQLGKLDELVFRATWSSNVLRSSTFTGKEWDLKWPGPSDGGPRDNTTDGGQRGIGAYAIHGSKEFTQPQIDVTIAPTVGFVVVIPKVGPLFTHASSGTVVVAEGESQKFCFDPSGCVCPTGQESNSYRMDGREMIFSMAASEDVPVVNVMAVKWDPKYCRQKEPKKGEDNGDPHLVSLDGQAFDVMARGEFVLARDTTGGFEVQARHSELKGVSVPVTGGSAVALGGTGTHRVMFGGDPNSVAPPTISIDGVAVADTSAPHSVDGIDITMVADNHWLATWADGSSVGLHWNHGWFTSIAVAPARAAHITGMLGNANGDFRDDLLLADGTHVDPKDGVTIDTKFAPLWYVTRAGSLFDYKPGETTESFRTPSPKPPPPPPADVVTTCTDTLPAAATRAEIAACAYDVAATGFDDYATTYADTITSRIADDPTSPLINTPTSPTIVTTPRASGSSVVLSGTMAITSTGPDVHETLTTAIDVVEGSIILGQVAQCSGGADVRMEAVLRGGNSQRNEVHLCDPGGFNVPDHDTDEVVPGEAALWASAGGTYDITIKSSADQPVFTSVTISTDPTPTIVNAADSVTKGYSGQLSGLADTVVMLPDTGGTSVSWTMTGLDKACGDDNYGSYPLGTGSPTPITFCGHPESFALQNSGEFVPFIFYAHTPTPVDLRVTPVK